MDGVRLVSGTHDAELGYEITAELYVVGTGDAYYIACSNPTTKEIQPITPPYSDAAAAEKHLDLFAEAVTGTHSNDQLQDYLGTVIQELGSAAENGVE